METLETLSADFRTLKISVQRQRIVIASLAAIIGVGAFIGATHPVGDGSFDTVTCRAWKLIDKDGTLRIGATTFADGEAVVQWFDKGGKMRIVAATDADGDATVQMNDKDGKSRISAATQAGGQASVQWNDKNGAKRIDAGTFPDGTAAVQWVDKDGKTLRILARTRADGTVVLPTKDEKAGFATDPQDNRGTIRKPLQKATDSCQILNFNGVKYQLADGDIPGLKGCGELTIQMMAGMSQSVSSGFTGGQCNVSQINGQTFVNDVDIAELVERLKSR